MKYIFLLAFAALTITACNPDNVDFSGGGSASLRMSTGAGTISTLPDSLTRIGMAFAPITYVDLGSIPDMGVGVTVPVIPDDYIEAAGLSEQFNELAKFTGGEAGYVNMAREVTAKFISILDTHLTDQTDLVFVIDATGSMGDDIENVKRGIITIIKHVRMKKDVRVGVSVYRDKNSDGNLWYSQLDLTTNYDSVIAYVQTIVALGGGWDWPESVYDATCLTLDSMQWRANSPKMLLLLGDAPALLPPLSDKTLEDVVNKSKEHGVAMNFYPVILTTFITPVITPVVTAPPVSKTFESKVYPNPTAGETTVEMNKNDEYTWQVTDVAGGILMEGITNGNQVKIDLSELPNGVYMIKVTNVASVTETKMIVVSH